MRPVSAKLIALVHATEDTEKVSRALDYVCPVLVFEQKLETRKFKGHYGNDIITLNVSLRKRSAGPFLQRMLKLLSNDERLALIHDLDRRIDDDGHLYVRLDKQECLQGRVLLAERDPIKCEFSFEVKRDNGSTPNDKIKLLLGSMIDL